MEPYIEKQFQPHPSNSGLLRFRSAPSSLISAEGGVQKGFHFNELLHNNGGVGVEVETKPFVVGYYGSNEVPEYQMEGSRSNLARQSSSPAGFFTHLNSPAAGYNMMRHLPRIPENTKDTTVTTSNPDDRYRNGEDDANGFSFASWNQQNHDSVLYSQASPSQPQPQNDGGVLSRQMLSHHLSLPNDLFDTSVPCKIRAKRGCATHPRSIAERVRRTRITERMKKLQELVPNMDKVASYNIDRPTSMKVKQTRLLGSFVAQHFGFSC